MAQFGTITTINPLPSQPPPSSTTTTVAHGGSSDPPESQLLALGLLAPRLVVLVCTVRWHSLMGRIVSPSPLQTTTMARFHNAVLRLPDIFINWTIYLFHLPPCAPPRENLMESFSSCNDAAGLPAQGCYSISCDDSEAWRTTGLATVELSKRIALASINETSISAESTVLAIVLRAWHIP